MSHNESEQVSASQHESERVIIGMGLGLVQRLSSKRKQDIKGKRKTPRVNTKPVCNSKIAIHFICKPCHESRSEAAVGVSILTTPINLRTIKQLSKHNTPQMPKLFLHSLSLKL